MHLRLTCWNEGCNGWGRHVTDHVQDFRDAIRRAGYEPDGPIIPDDKARRLHLKGDRGKETSFKYKLKIESSHAAGWFTSYKDGVVHSFSSRDSRGMTPAERIAAARRRKADAARAAAEQEATYAAV